MWMYTLWIYSLSTLENTDDNGIYFFPFTTPQAFLQSSASGAFSTLVTSVVLYSLIRTTLMSPGKDETRVSGYLRSEFIHWALWRTLMRTEYFLFVHHTTSILANLSTWCFEHSGDISCSLLVNPSHTDESWEGRNTWMWIYTLWIYWDQWIYSASLRKEESWTRCCATAVGAR